jgi:hypothetical protein
MVPDLKEVSNKSKTSSTPGRINLGKKHLLQNFTFLVTSNYSKLESFPMVLLYKG